MLAGTADTPLAARPQRMLSRACAQQETAIVRSDQYGRATYCSRRVRSRPSSLPCHPGLELGAQFEALARRLRGALNDPAVPSCLVGVTSCARGEGVSTVASHLAAYATHVVGSSVLLMEANLDERVPGAAFRSTGLARISRSAQQSRPMESLVASLADSQRVAHARRQGVSADTPHGQPGRGRTVAGSRFGIDFPLSSSICPPRPRVCSAWQWRNASTECCWCSKPNACGSR